MSGEVAQCWPPDHWRRWCLVPPIHKLTPPVSFELKYYLKSFNN